METVHNDIPLLRFIHKLQFHFCYIPLSWALAKSSLMGEHHNAFDLTWLIAKGTFKYHMMLREEGEGVYSNRQMGEGGLAKSSYNFYSG